MYEREDLHRRFDELRHRFDLLQGKMEADMKILQAERKQSKAESDSAIDRLRVHIETLRTDMLQNIKSTSEAAVTRLMIAMGIGFAFLGLIITIIK